MLYFVFWLSPYITFPIAREDALYLKLCYGRFRKLEYWLKKMSVVFENYWSLIAVSFHSLFSHHICHPAVSNR